LPTRDRRFHAGFVGPETLGQYLEKCDARTGRQFAITIEDLGRQRDAGGFTTPREQMLAKLDDRFRMGFTLRLALAAQEGAAALGNRLQELAEKRTIHPELAFFRKCRCRNDVAIASAPHKIA
jgi:hypothetical protein